MEKQTARSLLKFVNEPHNMEDLQIYAKHRMEYLRSQLEISNDLSEINKIQGAIAELKRVFHLKEEVKSKAE